MLQVKKHFRTKILKRLDEIIISYFLKKEEPRKVVGLQMKSAIVHLVERGFYLVVNDAILDLVLEKKCMILVIMIYP